jgi:hypothetical protein
MFIMFPFAVSKAFDVTPAIGQNEASPRAIYAGRLSADGS